MSSNKIPKREWRTAHSAGLLLFPLLPTLLKGLPAYPVASLVQVVGHKGTDSSLSWFILVVIIVETYAVLGSRHDEDRFRIRPCTQVADAAVAYLQSAVVGEGLVLLEYFLSDSLQHVVAAHPSQNGLQTDHLAAYLTLFQAPDRCLLAIS